MSHYVKPTLDKRLNILVLSTLENYQIDFPIKLELLSFIQAFAQEVSLLPLYGWIGYAVISRNFTRSYTTFTVKQFACVIPWTPIGVQNLFFTTTLSLFDLSSHSSSGQVSVLWTKLQISHNFVLLKILLPSFPPNMWLFATWSRNDLLCRSCSRETSRWETLGTRLRYSCSPTHLDVIGILTVRPFLYVLCNRFMSSNLKFFPSLLICLIFTFLFFFSRFFYLLFSFFLFLTFFEPFFLFTSLFFFPPFFPSLLIFFLIFTFLFFFSFLLLFAPLVAFLPFSNLSYFTFSFSLLSLLPFFTSLNFQQFTIFTFFSESTYSLAFLMVISRPCTSYYVSSLNSKGYIYIWVIYSCSPTLLDVIGILIVRPL